MTNIEKYNAAFVEVFGVTEEVLNDSFSKENVEGWDSVHQLNIISILEDSFDGVGHETADEIAVVVYFLSQFHSLLLGGGQHDALHHLAGGAGLHLQEVPRTQSRGYPLRQGSALTRNM